MSKFDIMETTVAKVQAAYLDGTLTCRELCEDYIARIKAYDHEGPAINSIICVNPKALEEADAFDAYVKEHHALCGPLHGIPVMLKDNFNTTDMPTTAGSIALEGWVPDKDAFVTKKLREAGALILAKTNLHEFAIWGETISSVMGQSVNPYDPTRTPGGSSGGTGGAMRVLSFLPAGAVGVRAAFSLPFPLFRQQPGRHPSHHWSGFPRGHRALFPDAGYRRPHLPHRGGRSPLPRCHQGV